MWRDTEGSRTSDGIPARLVSGCLLPLRNEASATPRETRKIHVLAVWRGLLLDLRTEDCHNSVMVPHRGAHLRILRPRILTLTTHPTSVASVPPIEEGRWNSAGSEHETLRPAPKSYQSNAQRGPVTSRRSDPTRWSVRVIPTLLLAGLLVGRWWFIPIAGAAWIIVVLFYGDLTKPLKTTAIGAANTGVGAGIRVATRWIWQEARRHRR